LFYFLFFLFFCFSSFFFFLFFYITFLHVKQITKIQNKSNTVLSKYTHRLEVTKKKQRNHREQCCTALVSSEQRRRVDSRATAGEDQQAGRSGLSPSSLPVRTGGASPSHLQSKPTTQTVPVSPSPLLRVADRAVLQRLSRGGGLDWCCCCCVTLWSRR
jgi:hypothetical protein